MTAKRKTAKRKTANKPAGKPDLVLPDWAANIPLGLAAAGALLAGVGAIVNTTHFAHAWLVALMFYLSIGLGALFLVIIHHLFDSFWIVPIRRYVEHIACLLPWMAVFFLPIAIVAFWVELPDHGDNGLLYKWMEGKEGDHAWHAKADYLNKPFWLFRAFLCFAVWGLLTYGLRHWSLKQDQTGDAVCTRRMRQIAAPGIFLFAFTLTLAAVDWMKGLEHQWFSTMYGVYYFAASVWTALITIYVIGLFLKKTGPLKDVVTNDTHKQNGTLFFAFTVFYAYIHFSQYFLIWNAAIPEETYWYVKREQGQWEAVGYTLVFGHFFLPFLTLLRIDVKLKFGIMVPMMAWAWLMHFSDVSFNIMPVIHPESGWLANIWIDLGCMALFGGLLSWKFIRDFNRHPPYPQKDPRIAETFGVYVRPLSEAKAGGK